MSPIYAPPLRQPRTILIELGIVQHTRGDLRWQTRQHSNSSDQRKRSFLDCWFALLYATEHALVLHLARDLAAD